MGGPPDPPLLFEPREWPVLPFPGWRNPLTTIAPLGYKQPILKPPLKVYGAPISYQDAKTIVEYLASAYGPTR